MKVRKAVRKALQLQHDRAGFTFVEILSPCPTIWKMTPQDSRKWMEEKMLPVFPLGRFPRSQAGVHSRMSVPQTTVPKLFGMEKNTDEISLPVAAKEPHADLTLKIAGFGGQGVLLLGQILAEMGMREGREVSWLPSYGPEMRSGSAHCHVCLNNERVGSPLVEHPDILVAMNELSLHKFTSTCRAARHNPLQQLQIARWIPDAACSHRLHPCVGNCRCIRHHQSHQHGDAWRDSGTDSHTL